jgi:hypothetical protein
MDYTEWRTRLYATVGRIRSVHPEMVRDIEAGGTAHPEMLEPFDAEIAELEEAARRAPGALIGPALRALEEGRLKDVAARLRKSAADARRRPADRDATGRDGPITLKQLANIIATVRPLPPHHREDDLCDEMLLHFLVLAGDERYREYFEETVRAHPGRRHDPAPPGDGG